MILLTGANSGIGYEAALRLAAQHHTLVLPCRTMDKSIAAILSIQQELPDAKLIAAECDLSSLSSIRAFAKALPSLIGNTNKLDTVCYNAGLSRSTKAQDVARTQDGFELTGQCGTVCCSVCILCVFVLSHCVLIQLCSRYQPFGTLSSSSFACSVSVSLGQSGGYSQCCSRSGDEGRSSRLSSNAWKSRRV